MNLFLCILILICSTAYAKQRHYPLTRDIIDVVIPCSQKDLYTLKMCIDGIRNNGTDIGRIIVISQKRLSKKAEWYSEASFPFTIFDVAEELSKGDPIIRGLLARPGSRAGWYYQQLLKLYAPLVIQDISPNVLVLDADTVFINPVSFLNECNGGLYNIGTEYNLPYFEHARLLIPGFTKIFPHFSGITHHMIFQRPVIDDLFRHVERIHRKPFWKVFCSLVAPSSVLYSGASEYEIYFNFVFSRTKQVSLRCLRWKNISKKSLISQFAKKGYHFVSLHSYDRIEE